MSITIALAGNPNSGKTTLFNSLTGSNQYVGNWPGVTVEKKEGRLKGNKDVTVVDLPGIYSLSPYTPEEIVSRDFLLNSSPDVILNLVDATNMERNLYLTTQILEIGLPVVIALNMADVVRKTGDEIDVKKLSDMLGCPVVSISALKGEGLKEAAALAVKIAKEKTPAEPKHRFAEGVEAAIGQLGSFIPSNVPANQNRWYEVKLFEKDEKVLESLSLDQAKQKKILEIVEAVEKEHDDDSESIITTDRYTFIAEVMKSAVRKKARTLTTSDKIDRIVTNRWLALPIFAVIMFVVYYIAVTTVGALVTDWTNDVLFGEWIAGGATALLEGIVAPAWVISLVVDGIIGGVGAVIGFVPQMIVLFLMLSFLEECGYMARVAFIMDRIFRKFGLSGKSFIPMLISSGCGVPGIMATKTIENEKDRRMTIITTTFIPCGAKLPIIALIGGAIMGNAWWVAPLIYFVGVAAVVVSGIVLKKTKLFAGDPAPFVMELPQYHMPAIKNLLLHTWERVRSFIVKAGTVIFVSSVLIWFLLTFGIEGGAFGMVAEIENSFLARFGSLIAPVFAPIGFGNWQGAVGAIAGLVAKENLVSTLAITFRLSEGLQETILDDTAPLWSYMQTMLPTVAAGLSFLVFNMICAPCFAAIGAIRRQMMSFKWTVFAVAYQTLFAYALSFMIYQFGSFLGGVAFGSPAHGAVYNPVTLALACVVLLGILFQLFRPAPKSKLQKVNA